ncbi:Holliday junction branch migration protein RuvA [Aureibacter tunicatorum]|uniref:Holliday junction branch migration complex subunit RuvA n=1 Tax=Aureibacter tunicatorum TaxID=866807 RepID=A0AAE4BRA0_9BACT|nr:Holliday junction branch migration protein RuvA [Aureibacter tunicatorum]MDR6237733.1 Holliday junction DNA helicase RuvA [Aureibacter tunicatorum]BDD02768.1 Holliday junction ATP-dependent DNA helicase RuvA [Aureibacter tunicatorum]
MIAYIKGELTHKEPAFIVLETGGIGYEVKISLNTFSRIKDLDECMLLTYMQVREDAHTLYGFLEQSEKKLFMLLIGISGVGANTALAILSSLGVEEIEQAIVNEDKKAIESVKGIGAKTAQRIILELKDKLVKQGVVTSKAEIAGGVSNIAQYAIREESLAALTTLGIAKATAEKAIESILKGASGDITTEEVIKQALKRK